MLRGAILQGALDELVELAAVEPNATALRTIIDLDACSIGHHQGN